MVGGIGANMISALVGVAVAIAAYTCGVLQQSAPARPPTSHQLLMRDKLVYSNKALEGLSMEDYGKIAEAGKMLGVISRTASSQIATEQYRRMSKNFQEQSSDLERHAKEKNLDAASLDYTRITLTCVQCHNYLRDVRKKD